MMNGNPSEFVDRIYSCQDTVFIFKGVKYWFQGYTSPNGIVHMEIFQYQPTSNAYLWTHDGKTIAECQQSFLDTPIFDGKTFWDAEKDIQWVDD